MRDTDFDPDILMAGALRRAGRPGFSDLSFLEPLRRLLDSLLAEADLSLFGRRATRFDLTRCLDNLLQLDAAEEHDPAITSRILKEPLFITGLPRSATTFLHALLAQDPENAVPMCWQLIYPYRSSRLPIDLRKATVELQLGLFRSMSPQLNALHPLSASTPQECTDITAQTFQSLRFETTHRIPSYQNWLDEHGHDRAFRFHRRFLQHLDAQLPGRRWVLKSPDHIFALDALRATYPDAKIVFLHRDPLSVVASCCKLTELLRRPFARHVNRAELGLQVSSRLVESAQRMMAAAQGQNPILHLRYDEIVSAPIEAVKALYRFCGRTLNPGAERSMRALLNRPRARNARRYELGEYGLRAETLREQFAPYLNAFDVAGHRAPIA